MMRLIRPMPVSTSATKSSRSRSLSALRAGTSTYAEDRPTSARIHSVWCSQRDIVDAIELAVDADDSIGYDIFFINSDNRWSYRDLSHAREVLGFAPRDGAGDCRG